jgi:hypothetical protein
VEENSCCSRQSTLRTDPGRGLKGKVVDRARTLWQAIGAESLITRRLRIPRRSDCRTAVVCCSFWEKGGYSIGRGRGRGRGLGALVLEAAEECCR